MTQPSVTLEEATGAARFNRLAGIVRRLRWKDVGVPAMEDAETKAALEDLSEWLFMDGIDIALAARANEDPSE